MWLPHTRLRSFSNVKHALVLLPWRLLLARCAVRTTNPESSDEYLGDLLFLLAESCSLLPYACWVKNVASVSHSQWICWNSTQFACRHPGIREEEFVVLKSSMERSWLPRLFQRLVCFHFLEKGCRARPFCFLQAGCQNSDKFFLKNTFSPCVFFPVCLGNPQSCTLNLYMGSVIVQILQTGFRFPILEIWDFDIGGCLNRATVGK